jgi:hypothetical protein
VEERLRLLQDLTHALANDIDRRDRRHHEEVAAVRTRLDALQRIAVQKWTEVDRILSAFYVAQFKSPEGGVKP